jgi:hypothetical protein
MNESDFNMNEVDLCKNCRTMKHLNLLGICGRCVKEAKRVVADRYGRWADIYQYGSIFLLLATVILCGSILPKSEARVAVWYLGGFTILTAITGGLLAHKALSYRMDYYRDSMEHIRRMGKGVL